MLETGARSPGGREKRPKGYVIISLELNKIN